MAKPPADSPPSKKRKVSNHQQRIDVFFGVPPGRNSTAQARPVASSSATVIDVDALDEDFTIPPTGQRMAAPSLRTPSKRGPKDAPASPLRPPTIAEVIPFSTFSALPVDPLFFALGSPPWPSGVSAPYSFLADALVQLTQTKSRISIINILVNVFRLLLQHDPPSLLPSLYLLSNSLTPPYDALELGIGSSIISKAIQSVSGTTPAALKRLQNQLGDPGDVAFTAKANVRTLVPHPTLRIRSVYDTLLRIARSKGTGSARTKQTLTEKLLVAARGEETRFLVRTLVANLRVGAVRTSILTALARAVALTPAASSGAPPPGSAFAQVPQLMEQVEPLLVSSSKKKVTDEARTQLAAVFSEAEELVKRVFVRHPSYDDLAAALLDVGLHGLTDRVTLSVGVPLLPTLGSPTRSLDEIYIRLQDVSFSAEFKYDGQRAQIHASRRDDTSISVRLFSRHLEDMTEKYPDVVFLIRKLFDDPQLQSFIMDAEIVATDPTDGALKTFQDLSHRTRKDVRLDKVSVAVTVFAFDLMEINGKECTVLLAEPFRSRRMTLRTTFRPVTALEHDPAGVGATGGAPARLDHVRSIESSDGRASVEQFWLDAITSDGPIEGLMIKVLDSSELVDLEGDDTSTKKRRRKPLPATYEPDKRTSAWLKLKKDYVDGLGDSLDLIPVGGWHGIGRKAQWWSPVLLAVWDASAGKPVAVCKCMSGFSDAFYKEMRARYAEDSDNCSTRQMWDCDTGGLRPAVYFKPQEVWEIRGADVTLSPVSVAALGLVSEQRGLSLRFPRFIRICDDKALEQASTPSFLAKMWSSQNGRKDRGGVDDFELMDEVDTESDGVEDEEETNIG